MELLNANNTGAPQNDKLSLFNFGLVTRPEPSVKLLHGQQVKIHPVIAFEQVLDAIQWSINYILDDRTFISAPLNRIIGDIAIVRYWTNIDTAEIDDISFDAMKLYEFYDALFHFGVIDAALEIASKKQVEFFRTTLRDTLDSLVSYRNSAAGIFEKLQTQSQTDKGNLNEALATLKDPAQMGVLQKVFDALGSEALGVDDLQELVNLNTAAAE